MVRIHPPQFPITLVEKSPETTVEQLAEALENIEGRTPQEVLDAFCPVGRKVGPFDLVPLSVGHELFLSRIRHPLASGKHAAWQPVDVAMALFAFTRSSSELEKHIEGDTLQDALHEFIGEIPLGGIDSAAADLLAHWIRARSTAVAMRVPVSQQARAAISKKKADSDGSYQSSPVPAENSVGRRIMSFIMSLFPNFSR